MATIRNATTTATHAATTTTAVRNPGALARIIALTGLFIGVVGGIDYAIFFYLTQHETPEMVYQYIASGLLGPSAFAGGYATALLGFLIHFAISFVVAAVFILASSLIAFLRRPVWAVVAGLVYGAAVNMFMSTVVLPYSAAPKMAVTTALVVHGLVGDALFVGLPVAIAALWYARTTQAAAKA